MSYSGNNHKSLFLLFSADEIFLLKNFPNNWLNPQAWNLQAQMVTVQANKKVATSLS